MADTTPNDAAPAKKTPAKSAKGATAKSAGPKKAAPRKTAATAKAPDPAPASTQVIEAKSRFSAALEEAKAGAAALRTEAENRLTAVGGQAKGKGTDLVAEAKTYAETAKGKAGEIAVEGKQVASDAISSLGKAVGDSAAQIDEKLGAQYGDYARKASRTLQETSAKLETKSVEELGEDAREMVRKSPGVAVGVAAVFGFFLARLLGGRKR
ncbi:MAG: hypothetical protein ACKO1O_05800 [Erythrobacter sp.]